MVLSAAWDAIDMEKEKVAYPVYRIALPKGADVKQKRNFEQQVAAIKRVNPGWVVVSDWVQPSEKEAYIIVRKDENYPYRRALYLAKEHLSRAISRGYNVKP